MALRPVDGWRITGNAAELPVDGLQLLELCLKVRYLVNRMSPLVTNDGNVALTGARKPRTISLLPE